MKPAPFEYHAAESVDDVVALLAEHGDEAKPLAGGQSLIPMLALRLARFEHLIGLDRVDALRRLEQENGTLVVGAMTRQVMIERDDIASAVPLLRLVAPLIGHFQIRNRGTVGGSIAHADPAGELPAVALALDAQLEIAAAGSTRVVPASEFFVCTWMTALGDEELLTTVRFPVWNGKTGFAVEEVARRHGDFALTGAVCGVEVATDGSVQRAAVALLGMGSTPVRAADAEAALVGASSVDVDLEEIGQLAVRDLDPPEDVHASAKYRKAVGARVVAKALARAVDDAKGTA
jgi:aerobic carbon-monoxide dehydrogenase medium subunit